jgi:hypothetical protein
VDLVRSDVSEKRIASIIRVTRIATCVGQPILVTLVMEAYVPPKNRFLQEPHCITSQKMVFFIVTAVKT